MQSNNQSISIIESRIAHMRCPCSYLNAAVGCLLPECWGRGSAAMWVGVEPAAKLGVRGERRCRRLRGRAQGCRRGRRRRGQGGRHGKRRRGQGGHHGRGRGQGAAGGRAGENRAASACEGRARARRRAMQRGHRLAGGRRRRAM